MENEGSRECYSCKRKMERTCSIFRPVIEGVVVNVRFTKVIAAHEDFDKPVYVCWECQQKIFDGMKSLAKHYHGSIGYLR
jgi:hypothetical protein